jgi:hypothetical protein
MRGLLIDTNLWLLFLVGQYDPRLIKSYKRTRRYTAEDYDVMSQIVRLFPRLVTTPHILAEVSNLSAELRQARGGAYVSGEVSILATLDERPHPSAMLFRSRHFARFGLTDAGIVQVAPGNCLVLTDDLPLANLLGSLSIDVVNFNHVRAINWGLA